MAAIIQAEIWGFNLLARLESLGAAAGIEVLPISFPEVATAEDVALIVERLEQLNVLITFVGIQGPIMKDLLFQADDKNLVRGGCEPLHFPKFLKCLCWVHLPAPCVESLTLTQFSVNPMDADMLG